MLCRRGVGWEISLGVSATCATVNSCILAHSWKLLEMSVGTLISIAAFPNFDFLGLIWFRTLRNHCFAAPPLRRHPLSPWNAVTSTGVSRQPRRVCHVTPPTTVFTCSPLVRTPFVSLVNEKCASLKLCWLFRLLCRCARSKSSKFWWRLLPDL